ncbi:MAG: hypothetical protein ACK5IB_06205 [Qingshengfaniella sp.]
MSFRTALALAALLVLSPALAPADEISDTLAAARSAYDEGDIARALEELSFAQALLQDMRTDSLSQYLPPAPEGWTSEQHNVTSSLIAFAPNAIGSAADYSDGTDVFTLTISIDNPLMAMFSQMASNPMLARAAGASLDRLGDTKVLNMDGTLTTVIASRILVQAEGAPVEIMMPIYSMIDFAGLEGFDF